MLRNDLTMPTTMPKVPKEDATLGTNATVSEALEHVTTAKGLKLCGVVGRFHLVARSAPRLARSDTMEAGGTQMTCQ